MGKFQDLTGMKFGRLSVLGIDHKEPRKPHGNILFWECLCECGNKCVVRGTDLKNNATLSCGCWQRAIATLVHTKHGLEGIKPYRIWKNIKDRCFNSNSRYYHRYGGRGITMYPAWVNDFQAFYDYVSKLEHFGEEGYSLDRINNDGNYEPSNLRWATRKEQSRNTGTNRLVEYNGVKMSVAEAAEKSGINNGTLLNRVKKGDRGERLFRPVKCCGR